MLDQQGRDIVGQSRVQEVGGREIYGHRDVKTCPAPLALLSQRPVEHLQGEQADEALALRSNVAH